MNLILYYSLSLYLSLHGVSADTVAAAPAASSTPVLSCTIRSPSSGSFFDLNKLHIVTPGTVSSKSVASKTRAYSWNTTGYDYGYNFTMNFCGPVVEDLENVVDVEKSLWRNVSAYYKQDGKIYSIGQQNDQPVLRGRKLVLNYTGGSYCGHGNSKRAKLAEDDDEDREDRHRQRKSTIISLLCDRDTDSPLLGLNFVGATEDECGYFFEARSIAACGGIEVAKQTVGPGGVFGIIVLIAVLVYFVGGCVYSRTVLQQRGWRQCPNYGLWAGAFSFLGDLFIILTSSCSRCLPSRKGYSRVTSNGFNNNNSRARGRDSDAENRLIDELNEEWDD